MGRYYSKTAVCRFHRLPRLDAWYIDSNLRHRARVALCRWTRCSAWLTGVSAPLFIGFLVVGQMDPLRTIAILQGNREDMLF